MDVKLSNDKRAAAEGYGRLSFIFGVISLAGLICCFPVMPVVAGLGIVFALISRGGANVYAPQAKKGLTFSIIGMIASIVLSLVVIVGSTWVTFRELKKDPKLVDEVRKQYEQIYDNMGQEVPDELYEMLDRMEEYGNELRGD